jgi:hypothetical protein
MTANAGDHLNLTKDTLPISSISVFITGFVKEQVKVENNLFKYIKITASEFVGGGSNLGKKFIIKCRYLIADERIDRKVSKTRKNSCLMVIGELIFVDSEFLIDIQDINFLSTSNANIEASTSESTSSLYTWTTASTSTGRLSAQTMANTTSSENTTNIQELNSNNENNEDLIENSQESNMDEEDLADTLQSTKVTKPRGKKRKQRK